MNTKLWRSLSLLFTPFLLGGCAYFQEEPLSWNISVAVPEHYDAWVEPLQLEATGTRTWRTPIGYKSCCWKEPWFSSGANRTPPPNYVLVRWFAFAERKYYGRLIEMPPDLEGRMRHTTRVQLGDGRVIYHPQNSLIIGLAPGGQIVIWLMNRAQNAEEIMRVQAVELAANDADYEVWLTNYEAEHGEYLKQHGLQLDRW